MSARSSRQYNLTSLNGYVKPDEQVLSDVLDTSRFNSLAAGIVCDQFIDPDRAYLIIDHSPDGNTWFEAARLNINMILNPPPVDKSAQLSYSPIMKFARIKVTSLGIDFNILSAWAEAKT